MQDWESMIAERNAMHGTVVTCLIADARVRNKKAAQKRIFKAHYDEDPQHFIALSREWKKEHPEENRKHQKRTTESDTRTTPSTRRRKPSGTGTTDNAKRRASSMSNDKHYPTHPGAEHPPMMTCEIPLEEYESLNRENAQLKAKLESVQASMYCDVVDANMENRRLKRALWLARALALSRFDVEEYLRKYTHCNSRFWNDGFNTFNEACEQMQKAINIAEANCRAKAEEYK
ncbi:MAG: hypothetical protein J6T62_04085 [Fibrobacter sp.]|nr:hypothetical protein [Fibrobacter sp.]